MFCSYFIFAKYISSRLFFPIRTSVNPAPNGINKTSPYNLDGTVSGDITSFATNPVAKTAKTQQAPTQLAVAGTVVANCVTTQTFAFTGAIQTFTVPSGVTSINLDVIGAQGMSEVLNDASGGLGGRVQTTLSVVSCSFKLQSNSFNCTNQHFRHFNYL